MKFNATILFIFALIATSLKTFAQTALPYASGFDNTTQQAGWTEYRLGNNGFYKWNFSTFVSYSPPASLIHNYPVGGIQVTNDWFVSPGLNFSAGGNIDSLRYAFAGFGVPATADTVAIYLLTGSANPTLATSKTLLVNFRGATYQNDNTWRVLKNVSIPPKNGTSYLAFRYKTVVNWLDVRFDNLRASGNAVTGIQKGLVQSNDFVLYHNPVKQAVQLLINDEKQKAGVFGIRIYDLTGKLVLQKNILEGEAVGTSQLRGIYIYTITGSNKVLLKSGKLLIN